MQVLANRFIRIEIYLTNAQPIYVEHLVSIRPLMIQAHWMEPIFTQKSEMKVFLNESSTKFSTRQKQHRFRDLRFYKLSTDITTDNHEFEDLHESELTESREMWGSCLIDPFVHSFCPSLMKHILMHYCMIQTRKYLCSSFRCNNFQHV